MKVAVIGTGLYSTALTYHLEKMKDNDIYLWTENKKLTTQFQKTRKFDFLSKTMKFDSNVFVSDEMELVLQDASAIFIMVGSTYFATTLEQIKPFYKRNTPIFVGTKGMDLKNGKFFSDMTRKYLRCNSYSFFSGPTFAKDLITNYPASFTFAGSNKIGYRKLARILPEDISYEYTDDLYGMEILAVLKNIYAIGSGILSGLKVPNTVYYTYVTDMIRDARTIMKKCCGEEETLIQYGGIGDFLMTSLNKTSRNFSYGKLLGSKAKPEEILEYQNSNTLEGFENLKEMPDFLAKHRMKSSLVMKIYQIVFEGMNPSLLYQESGEKKSDSF